MTTATPTAKTTQPQRRFTITTPEPNAAPTHFSILVIGDYKMGKSFLGCTAPNPLFIQFDPNLATVEKFGHPRIDLSALDPVEAWKLWDTEILPAITNREFPYDSIVLDSYTFLARALQAYTPVPRTNAGEDNTMKWYGRLYEELKQTTMKLRSASRPFAADPSRPTYNIIATVHAQPQYRKMDGDKIILEKYVPQIDGKFAREFGSFFGAVFWAEKYTSDNPDQKRNPDGTPKGRPLPKVTGFRMWTSPPDKMRNCQDSYGGPPGPLKKLPSTIENTWPALLEGWGISENKADKETQ